MEELNFDSASNFTDQVATILHDKAVAAIDDLKQDMMGQEIEESEIEFDPEDMKAIIKIADSVGVEYDIDDNDEIEITDEDEDKIDEFLSALDDADIDYDIEDEEDDIDEAAAPKRVHTSAADKLAHKQNYRKNRSKIKIKAKRYRKTAHAKRMKKISKRKAKLGKTATGRRIIKRI